jgi:hypothetical protein
MEAPGCNYHSLVLRHLYSHYKDRYGGPLGDLTVDMNLGLYLDIMYRYGGPHCPLTIALHKGFYLAIIIYRYGGPHSALTI